MPEPQSVKPETLEEAWDYSNPAASQKRFEELLAQNDDPDAELEIETQIARAQGLQKAYDDAHATLDSVDRKRAESTPRVSVRYLLERGRVFNSSGKASAARPLFVEAWELARANQLDGLAVDAAHMVGIVEQSDASLEWNQKALELARSSGDPTARKWRASLHNNVGWLHHEQGRYETALGHLERALELREEEGDEASIRVAKWSIGHTYRTLERYEDACAIQLKLEEECRAAGEEDGFVYEELGECYLELDEQEKARGYFAKAHPLLKKVGYLAESRMNRIAELGGVEPNGPTAE